MSTALTPARAADMTDERALNPQREPQNWILHHATLNAIGLGKTVVEAGAVVPPVGVL
jgi:hypothetical protein